ncbi:hypothetical protein KAR91_34655 [Candidatus Pacearchaeota archaeon]|nr:hypothetical protein [Candidatus Pacearchaeota archaeon]
MKKVFVVNKSSHDFSPALEYGELIFMSEGSMSRYAVNNMHRQFNDSLEHSHEDDYILMCGLSTMNSVACSIFAARHKRLNLLLFKSGRYIERNIIL